MKEMMAPTVNGTMNVLEACTAMEVQKIVMLSSLGSSCLDPNWPEDKLIDESCWSDKEFCTKNEYWYALAKTKSEEVALEYGKSKGLHVVTLLPSLVFGPLLQTVVLNTSSKVLVYMIKGGPDRMSSKFWPIVDVRDVADALFLAYEKGKPSSRYICSLDQMDTKHILDVMRSMYPKYNYVDRIVDVGRKIAVTSAKLVELGWKPRKLEDTLADSIESYKNAGFLDDKDGKPCRIPYMFTI